MAISPLKAIREKCLECSCGQTNEVRLCPIDRCPLYPYRFGKNPVSSRKKRELTPEEKIAIADRLRKAREAKKQIEV